MSFFRLSGAICFLPLAFCFLFLSSGSLSQPSGYKLSRREYVERFRDLAVREMLLNDIPASITMSQALLESDNGNSPLAVYANNHFGIKCHAGWNGLTYIKDDDTRNECFRKYPTALESYEDHSAFLKTRPRYRDLFYLSKNDYKGWAYGLKDAGYATNPQYARIIIDVIEDNKLYELDKVTAMPKIIPSLSLASSVRFGRREIHLNNRVKYIITRDGDTYFKVVTDMEMMLWEVFKYNDLLRTDKLLPGQIIYIQPKRNKNFTTEYHIVQQGETLFDISQKFAVKLRKLCKYNNLAEEAPLEAGTKIWLKRKR